MKNMRTFRSMTKMLALAPFFMLGACGGQIPEKIIERDIIYSETAEDRATQQNDIIDGSTNATENSITSIEKIKIAVLLPLSGEVGETGQALLNAATMALFDAYDPRLQLLPYDTRANITQTETVTREAIKAGADIIIGPLLSANVQIAGNIAGEAGIPLIGFSNDYKAASPNSFILGFLPENEVRRVVNYAVSKGYKEFAGLFPEGRYGDQVRSAYGLAVSNSDALLSTIETYQSDADQVFEPVKTLADYDRRRRAHRNEVRFLKSLNDDMMDEIVESLDQSEVLGDLLFDAVIVPEGGALLRTVAPLLPFYEIDTEKVKVLGTGLWNDKTLTNEPPLYGAWFAAPDPEAPESFFKRYETLFKAKPPRITTLAYDAVGLIAILARDKPEASENDDINGKPHYFSKKALTDPAGFKGVDGLFRLLPDGSNDRVLAVLEIQKGEFKVIDPAASAFPAFGFSLKRAALPK
jgi:ABC-type branched-subunit amino acid transport system substrate-binding protein